MGDLAVSLNNVSVSSSRMVNSLVPRMRELTDDEIDSVVENIGTLESSCWIVRGAAGAEMKTRFAARIKGVPGVRLDTQLQQMADRWRIEYRTLLRDMQCFSRWREVAFPDIEAGGEPQAQDRIARSEDAVESLLGPSTSAENSVSPATPEIVLEHVPPKWVLEETLSSPPEVTQAAIGRIGEQGFNRETLRVEVRNVRVQQTREKMAHGEKTTLLECAESEQHQGSTVEDIEEGGYTVTVRLNPDEATHLFNYAKLQKCTPPEFLAKLVTGQMVSLTEEATDKLLAQMAYFRTEQGRELTMTTYIEYLLDKQQRFIDKKQQG